MNSRPSRWNPGRARLSRTSSTRSRSPATASSTASALGAGRLWREVVNTFRTIGAFFTGNISFDKNVAGPITLVTVSSEHSERSFLDLLWFLAYVSVMLAVLNILPIPVLDGGHIVYLVAEKIRGRPLSDAVIGAHAARRPAAAPHADGVRHQERHQDF